MADEVLVREHPINEDGEPDTVYRETLATLVLTEDGSTVQIELDELKRRDAELDARIDDVELTPGPPGPPGEDAGTVYKCTGTADSTAIANIVNDFFANGTAMTMKLIIAGAMGVEYTNNHAVEITANNARGAVCHLDFSDCDIPSGTSGERSFLYINSPTVRIATIGLRTTMSGYGVYIEDGVGNTFAHCIIRSSSGTSGYGVYMAKGSANTFFGCKIRGAGRSGIGVMLLAGNDNIFNYCEITGSGNTGKGEGVNIQSPGNNTFVGCKITGSAPSGTGVGMHTTADGADGAIIEAHLCKIIGTGHGIEASVENADYEMKLTGCKVRGDSGQDINQITYSGAIKWHIMGNTFSRAGIVVDGETAIAYKAPSPTIYFPQYANQFNETVE